MYVCVRRCVHIYVRACRHMCGRIRSDETLTKWRRCVCVCVGVFVHLCVTEWNGGAKGTRYRGTWTLVRRLTKSGASGGIEWLINLRCV